jgi:hypothetical protein
MAVRGNLAKQPQGPCLVATFLTITGKHQGTLGELECVFQAAGQEVGLAQCGHASVASSSRVLIYYHPLEQWQDLSDPPGQGIRQAQGRYELVQEERDVRGTAMGEGAFEHGDSMLEIPFAQSKLAEPGPR